MRSDGQKIADTIWQSGYDCGVASKTEIHEAVELLQLVNNKYYHEISDKILMFITKHKTEY